ncbi:MAG: type II secretion system protein GspK [Gemmataceae bacterium]
MLLYRASPRRRGVVLLAVLIVVVLLSLAAYKYNDWMTAEAKAADSGLRADQARAFAASGVHYAAALLAGDTSQTLGGNPWDNAEKFQHVQVPTAGQHARPGRFSVVSVRPPDEASSSGGQAFRFGVTCESGKINLNALLLYDNNKGEVGRQILMGLPNMTEEIAAAILDWLDPDDTPRENGAENESYTSLDPPYRCKNGPLDSLEELLLVKGVTPQLLFGNDKNRNGVIDPDEGDGDADLGWQAYLTVYSREVNVGPDNLPRIYLNNKDLQGTIEKLKPVTPEELYLNIAAARLYGTSNSSSGGRGGSGGGTTGGGTSGGGSSGGAGGGTSATGGGTAGAGSRTGGGGSGGSGMAAGGGRQSGGGAASTAGGSRQGGGSGGATQSSGGASSAPASQSDLQAAQAKIQEDIANSANKQLKNIGSLWDLVGGSVSITVGTGQQQKTVNYPSPITGLDKQRELLPKLWLYCTTSNNMDLTPRLNVNTAPQAALATLKEVGGLTDEDVSNIVSKRPQPGSTTTDEVFQSPAWLLTEANLSSSKVKKLDPYITTRSQVYRMQVLGYFDKGGPTARVEAVVDTNLGKPRIVYFRDLSELGKGFDVGSPE